MADAEQKPKANGAVAQPQVVPVSTTTPTPLPSYAAQQVTTYTPPIFPPEVWTTELAEKHLTNMKGVADRTQDYWNDQARREQTKAILGFVLFSIVILASLWFVYIRVPGGHEILIGALAFVAGFIAGDGYAKSKQPR